MALLGGAAVSRSAAETSAAGTVVSLNGVWEFGAARKYDGQARVPGVPTDPTQINSEPPWYRKEVLLPSGDWTHATVYLNGARFSPRLYVNGAEVSHASGGMTVTTHLLSHPDVKPGRRVVLEIELQPLNKVATTDASFVPIAEQWRSNLSSCLWDSVTLRLHRHARITRMIPFTSLQSRLLEVHSEYQVFSGAGRLKMVAQLLDPAGRLLASTESASDGGRSTNQLRWGDAVQPWSPENPSLYRLRGILKDGGVELDRYEFTYAPKEFRIAGLGFELNRKPVTLRAAAVAWHRWVRTPEGRALGFDTNWVERNVVQRLKSHGANALCWTLAFPPETMLDLCDRHGLMVQAEWPFFHGLPASSESMLEQWRNWLDLSMRHPSVVIAHPWNETDEAETRRAFGIVEKLSGEYPPLVISHRDLSHLHRYWWSLFENLGLYYDSPEQLGRAAFVDEFGGNYLDGDCQPGGYPQLPESFLRFLGRGHTKELRLQLHTEANTQVAEYWRRIGVAGFSPFVMLSSWEDGNHHFLGPLVEGKPKPLWDGLTAAYSPRSCSLEVWDRNFEPSQKFTMPLWFFNDTDSAGSLTAAVRVVPENDLEHPVSETPIECPTPAHGRKTLPVTVTLPGRIGNWRLQAILRNRVSGVQHPIVSQWRVRTMSLAVPAELRTAPVALPAWELELPAFLTRNGIAMVDLPDPTARLIVTSAESWSRIAADSGLRQQLELAIARGGSVVMLDIGPRDLGKEYPEKAQPSPERMALFFGTEASFRSVVEAESHFHPSPAPDAAFLWNNLDRQATWLWNGLRGGLVAPASEMEVSGLSKKAFLNVWKARGADPDLLLGRTYFAYELAGFYAFSRRDEDSAREALKRRVRQLADDAPALSTQINPAAAVRTYNLAVLLEACRGEADQFVPLANCGKNLTRVPVLRIGFGPNRGCVVLSQLITAGRLAEGFGGKGLYGLRQDVAAQQFVLNLLSYARSGVLNGTRD